MSAATRAPRRGFILATSLLVLALLTVMLTAAFVMVNAEFRTTDNAAASARALAIAEAGLQNYFTLNRGLTAASTYDSIRITLTGGYADVVAQRLRAAVGGATSLWSVRSTGYPSLPLLSGTPAGRRTVARLAQLYPSLLPARAALVALNGTDHPGSGTSLRLTGADLVGSMTGCTSPGTDTFGLSIYRGNNQFSNAGRTIGGDGVDSSLASQASLYDSTRINWQALVDDTAFINFTPDIIIPPGSLPAATGSGVPASFPLIYAPGNLNLTALSSGTYQSMSRKGILVVGGDLTLPDYTHWDGVILVGGRLNIGGGSGNDFIIDGMVITGLNTRLSPPSAVGKNPMPETNASTSTSRLAWSWCWVQVASNSLSGFSPVRRFWTDGWALY